MHQVSTKTDASTIPCICPIAQQSALDGKMTFGDCKGSWCRMWAKDPKNSQAYSGFCGKVSDHG